ncbi:MAG: M4 family metallopeptidase [Bacteroidales bacterium]|nr:M4 family metallopeptidase [Bacteroidales bacterium]
MKRVLFSLFLALLSLTAIPQAAGEFNSLSKKYPAASPGDFVYRTIQKPAGFKSADLEGSFRVSPCFLKPGNQVDPSIERVVRSAETGTPIFIEREQNHLKSAGILNPEERFLEFFKSTGDLTGIKDAAEDLTITDRYTDDLGITHVKARQLYNGIEIYGAEVTFHFNDRKEVLTGRISRIRQDPGTVSQIGPEAAIGAAIEDLKLLSRWRDLTETQKALLNYNSPSVRLVIYPAEPGTESLCYEVDIRANFLEQWKYFIDAREGRVIDKFNNTKSDGPATASAYDLGGILQTIDTYLENGTYLMVNVIENMFDPEKGEGIIRTFDASVNPSQFTLVSSPNNSWNNPAAVSLHNYAKIAYRYLLNTFGRNSLNDQGGTITGVANLTEEDGSGMDNAFWSSPVIYFGNGGTSLYNLAGGQDVVAHEMGHGVVENTANLEYRNQPGAINETYADIFGSMVDRDDWLIGEDVVKTAYYPTGAMRNMSDPHNGGTGLNDYYWQPAHVSEMYIGEEDNGGVHINNSIGSHAYYLFATAAGKEKAEQVFYRALKDYLTTKSQFIDFRLAVTQAAKDIHGDNSTEVTQVANAFDAVGIFEEDPVDYEQSYPENSGAEYILSYDTNPEDPNTLYRCTANGEDFQALSTTAIKRKISVVDNGTVAVFVSEDSKLRVINTDPSNPDEAVLSDDAYWDNIAVSKDGNRIACISIYIDTSIYVYDFGLQQWAQFYLYNPTTSHSNTNTGGVLYADAIEFDHSGEYLLYDAYNELSTTTGEPISYWDIGFIKVWDSKTNNFGDGSIEKLYGSLPEDVSIGNPVFAKNSPNIIAFDYWDAYSDEYAILGADLLTGEVSLITENTRLGFPSYSKSDDKISFTADHPDYDDIIAIIPLAENRISAGGEPYDLIADASWSVFYATGSRELGLAPVPNFTVDVKNGNAPLTVQFIDLSINDPTAWSWTFEGGTPATSNQQNPVITYNNPGSFQVSLTSTNAAGSNSTAKTGYISVSGGTGIESRNMEQVRYYPNPVSDVLQIDCKTGFTVRIYNMPGKKLVEAENLNRIDFSSFDPGVYLIRIEAEGKVVYGKVSKL